MRRRTNPITFSNARDLRHSQTDAEVKLWSVIRNHGLDNTHFRRKHAIGGYIVDFCSPRKKLIIELDGEPHLGQQDYDAECTAILESKGYQVLRFWNSEVVNYIDGVLFTILDSLNAKHKQ